MLDMRGLFSESYNEYLDRRDQIRSLVIRAKELLKGGKLYGKEIDINNPEHLIACLFVLYKDYQEFHEPLR